MPDRRPLLEVFRTRLESLIDDSAMTRIAYAEKIGVDREKKDLLFTMANGQTITRSVGFAILRVDKYFTIDEVVLPSPET